MLGVRVATCMSKVAPGMRTPSCSRLKAPCSTIRADSVYTVQQVKEAGHKVFMVKLHIKDMVLKTKLPPPLR